MPRDPFRCLDDPDPEPVKPAGPPAAAIVRDPSLAEFAPARSTLRVNGEFLVHFRRYRPGPVRRFLTWLVLGWTWERFDG